MRFHLLAYPAPAADNLAVRVTDVERRTTGDEAALFRVVAAHARWRRLESAASRSISRSKALAPN